MEGRTARAHAAMSNSVVRPAGFPGKLGELFECNCARQCMHVRLLNIRIQGWRIEKSFEMGDTSWLALLFLESLHSGVSK